MDPTELMLTALKFNQKINAQDLEGLAELMAEDHTFIDNDGKITKGKEAMKESWRRFFKQCPDYRNIFTNIEVQDDIVIITGCSKCSNKLLDGPNIWTAKVRDGLVSEWRVCWLDQR